MCAAWPAHAVCRLMACSSPGSCVSALGCAREAPPDSGHSIRRTCAALLPSPDWLWRTDPAMSISSQPWHVDSFRAGKRCQVSGCMYGPGIDAMRYSALS